MQTILGSRSFSSRYAALLAVIASTVVTPLGVLYSVGFISIVIVVGNGNAVHTTNNMSQDESTDPNEGYQKNTVDSDVAVPRNALSTKIWHPRAEVLSYPLLDADQNNTLVEQERVVRGTSK